MNTFRLELPWFAFCIGMTVSAAAMFLGCFYFGLQIAGQFFGWSFP